MNKIVSREIEQKLQLYADLLLKWQRTINLVSPKTINHLQDRHFADSLQMLDYLPSRALTLCDLGSGAGFPGLVIAIARPDIHVHLIESDERKCAFLKTVSRETQAHNVETHNGRIEEKLPAIPDLDIITARALAPLATLLNYMHMLQNPAKNHKAIFLKGEKIKDEMIEAQQNFSFEHRLYQSHTNSMSKLIEIQAVKTK